MRPTRATLIIFMFCLIAASAPAQDTYQKIRTGPTTPELERRNQPVTEDDLEILDRASEILASESVWNHEDDRVCDDDELAGRRSLFCALQKACIEVLGVYDHRRVAIQEVRFAIEDAAEGQVFVHRLRDYNNLQTTGFSDVHRVIEVARERVGARLARTED